MTAKLTYSKVAGLLQNLVKKGVNIHHPLIADEGVKIIDEYAEQQATEFAEWVGRRYKRYATGWVPNLKRDPYNKENILTTETLYQIFKREG